MISVLVVDDESSLLDISTLYLERTGQFAVETALSAPAALGKVREKHYDAIVSDYQMPGMDGIQFLKELRGAGDQTPFIVFTGKGREEVVIEAFNEGADFYLQKGGEPKSQFAELGHKIRQAVDLRREERARKESEENYRFLFENATEGILIAQGDRMVFVNPMLAAILGYPLDVLTSRPFTEFIHPDDRDMVLDRHMRRMKGEEIPTGYPFRTMRADGTERWVEINSRRIQWSGSPASLSFLIDVTERKQMEEALQRSEEKYRNIFENSPVGIYQVTPEGTFISANTTAAGILGYSSAAELMDAVKDIRTQVYAFPADRERAVRIMKEKGVLQDFEVLCQHKNGRLVWVSFSAKPVLDARGKVLYHEGTSQDISRRKEAEEALRRNEALYRSVLTASPDDITITDLSGTVTMISPAAFGIFGYQREEEILGRHISSFLVPEDRERAVAEITKMHEGILTGPGQYRAVRADGNTIDIEVNGEFVRDTSGKPASMVFIIRDITARKRVERKLGESEDRFRHISGLISDIAFSCRKVQGGVFTIDWISGAVEEITGYMPAEVQDLTCWRPLVIGEDLPIFDRDVVGLVPGQSTRAEMRIKNKNDRIVWLACYTACIPDPEDPASHRLYGACRDISKRKAAEAQVRLHAIRTQAVLGLYRMRDVPDTDIYLYALEAGPKVTKSGYSFIGMISADETVMTIHAWSAGAMDVCAIEKKPMQFPIASAGIWGDAVRTRAPVVVNDYPASPERRGVPAGHVPITRFLGVPVFDGARVVAVVAVANKEQEYTDDDIDALATLGNTMWELIHRRKAEEALRMANKKLSLLGSATRHDISNQLMIITGYLDLVREQVKDPDTSPYFTRIEHAAARIEVLIRFSKAYEQIGVQAPQWQDCHSLTESAIIEASVAHIRMQNEVPAGTEIYTDPLIARVFFNLVDNAVRYGEKITTIRLSGREAGGSYLITCEDDGIGIPHAEKEKIFERGYGKNTGMGLFLAREILAITGITIAETGEPGKGARFEITVPAGAWRIAPRGGSP